MDRTTHVFHNEISKKTVKKANKTKAKFYKKFGDDSHSTYSMGLEAIDVLNNINVYKLVPSKTPLDCPEKSVVIGNIRMGFGHYRIAIALASCANALGYTPLWFDLSGFPQATGSKMITHQNNLYSMGSRWSQKYKLFNALYWEPLNSEGFRKLDYNAVDQKNAEILVPMYNDLPKDIPFVGTHVWPSQGAVHSGLTRVVNAIPDNWPMGLHLAEGSIHTVQTPFAYLGYKMLNGMASTPLLGMPEGSLVETGYYIDHELVSNIVADTEARLQRIKDNQPLRMLLPVGGAGAGKDMFISLIRYLLPYIQDKKVQLYLNFGDHLNVWNAIKKEIDGLDAMTTKLFDDYLGFEALIKSEGHLDDGIYAIYHKDIFEAVYSTNILMRSMDLIATKPSELSYYPIPKFFIKRVGGHEAYGAIHSSEVGDGTYECDTKESMHAMLQAFLTHKEILTSMNHNILKLHSIKRYHGGYRAIELATK